MHCKQKAWIKYDMKQTKKFNQQKNMKEEGIPEYNVCYRSIQVYHN